MGLLPPGLRTDYDGQDGPGHRWQNCRVHTEEERKRLRQTFDAAAARYDRVRPEYPEALFDFLATRLRRVDLIISGKGQAS